MHNLIGMQVVKSLGDLFEQSHSISLAEVFILFHVVIQIFIALLHHQIKRVLVLDNVIELHHIGVV